MEWQSWPAIAGFEDGGRGPGTKECGLSLETEKSKEMYSSLEPPEKNAALLTP